MAIELIYAEDGREAMQNYSDRLAGLIIEILDHYCPEPLPESMTWLLPTLKEALFLPESDYLEWIYALLEYVARECGVPLSPQEEEHDKRAS